MIKETFIIKLTYEMSVDSDTGEVLETKLIKREVDNSDLKVQKSTKKITDNDTEPKLYLEENKYRLNNAAVKLMNLSEDSRLDIRYEQGKNYDIPIIGTEENIGSKGNKITKSNTVAYKGNKNSELAKYGNEFIIVPHPSKSGLFILTSDSINLNELVGDENVNIEGEEDVPFDLEIDDLIDDKDSDAVKIDSNFFKL